MPEAMGAVDKALLGQRKGDPPDGTDPQEEEGEALQTRIPRTGMKTTRTMNRMRRTTTLASRHRTRTPRTKMTAPVGPAVLGEVNGRLVSADNRKNRLAESVEAINMLPDPKNAFATWISVAIATKPLTA